MREREKQLRIERDNAIALGNEMRRQRNEVIRVAMAHGVPREILQRAVDLPTENIR